LNFHLSDLLLPFETSLHEASRFCQTNEFCEYRPDDGGSKDLWNVGKLLPDYTALQPRRQPSS
jgi:hypothetical protein